MWPCCLVSNYHRGRGRGGGVCIHRLQQASHQEEIQECQSSGSHMGKRHGGHLKDPSAHVSCISTKVLALTDLLAELQEVTTSLGHTGG